MPRRSLPSGLPDAVERRERLYGRLRPRTDHRALGEEYYRAGRLMDALEFWLVGGYEEGIARVQEDAVAAGDAFLLSQIERLGRRELPREVWEAALRRAEAQGKEGFARQCRERLGSATEDDAEGDGSA